MDNLINKLTDTQKLAAARLEVVKQKYKALYDRKLKIVNFKEGDDVMLLKEPRKNKLDDHYRGPYKVVKVCNDRNVLIDLGYGKTKIAHANTLKLAFHRFSGDEDEDN